MQAHADYIAQPQSVASQAARFSTMGINDLQKAAKAGQAGAQFYLGTHYQYGKDVAKDDKQAFAWFKAAADQGLSPAQLNVGRMYADGIGVKKMSLWLVNTLKKQQAMVITVQAITLR